MKRFCIISLMLILLLPFASAKQGSIKLLAVKETPAGYIGSKADLYLETRPGEGRVFLDTRPLTKLDTQISQDLQKRLPAIILILIAINMIFSILLMQKRQLLVGRVLVLLLQF